MVGYIYIIQNTINNKVYIGQTSVSIEHRWHQHLASAKRGVDNGIILYKAMRKYGIENFYVTLIEKVDYLLLDEKEKYWIEYYNSIAPNGYNVRKGGEDVGRKEVYKIDPVSNQIIECYASATAASVVNNIDLSSLTKVCRGEQNSCNGYKWAYKDNYNLEEIKEKQITNHTTAVYQIDCYSGKIIKKFNTIKDAAKELNISYTNISNALSGKNKTAGGYNWCDCNKYDKNTFQTKTKTKQVYQIDKNTQQIIKLWKDAKEAALFLNKKDIGSIQKVCRKQQKTAYGYIWRYKEDIDKNVK